MGGMASLPTIVKPVKDRENYIKDILKEETPEFDH
jgi:hypothetical protein